MSSNSHVNRRFPSLHGLMSLTTTNYNNLNDARSDDGCHSKRLLPGRTRLMWLRRGCTKPTRFFWNLSILVPGKQLHFNLSMEIIFNYSKWMGYKKWKKAKNL